jgi:hypothetical protein
MKSYPLNNAIYGLNAKAKFNSEDTVDSFEAE